MKEEARKELREEAGEGAREEAQKGANEEARKVAEEEAAKGAGEEGQKGAEKEAGEEVRKGRGATRRPPSVLRLTGRDKELLAHVATARYLTLQQLKRVVFVRSLTGKERAGASSKEGPSDVVCRRRLVRLCDARPAYLRRLEYRDSEGASVAVYATEPLGYSIARQVLGRAPAVATQDVKAQFLEHTVRLNDLYVALGEGCARQRVAPSRYPFWWISTESAGLPWQEQNGRTGRTEERRLVPDAILEIPTERVRIFLECEMGGHPLVRRDENALGSALSKVNRYATFVVEGAPRTFYAQKYPDGWRAELAFLVHSDQRAANLMSVIARWREQNRGVPLAVIAVSFAQAAAHFAGRLRLAAPLQPRPTMEPFEPRVTCSFVSQVAATYKAVRQYLRANPAIRAQGCPYPEYTPEFERMVALVERYRAQLGSKP